MNTGRQYLSGCGTQTAAMGAGGYNTPPFTAFNNTELYDGTNWSNAATLGSSAARNANTGSTTAALSAGGQSPTNTLQTISEEWTNPTTATQTITTS